MKTKKINTNTMSENTPAYGYKSRYEYQTAPKAARVKISNSKDAERVLRAEVTRHDCQLSVKEYFFTIYTNQANEIIQIIKIAEGCATGCVADLQQIAREGILCGAQGFILCHNHPSDTLKPSAADLRVTEKMKKGLEALDLRLLDHLILGTQEGNYYSFSDEGNI